MVTYRLTILPGDGTGPEVIQEAEKLLDVIEAGSPLAFERTVIPCGGQYWLKTGEEWPKGSFEHCRDESDAILLGAIGWPGAELPNGDIAGGQVILGLRSGLDLFANVRPIKLYRGVRHKIHDKFTQVWSPDKVDMVVLRENTEGLYHSLLRRSANRRGRLGPASDIQSGVRAAHSTRIRLRAAPRRRAQGRRVTRHLRRQEQRHARLPIVPKGVQRDC